MKSSTYHLCIKLVAIVLIVLPVFGSAPCPADKSVRTIFVQWKPHGKKLVTRALKELDTGKDVDLTESEIRMLSKQRVTGTLEIVGSQVHGQHNDPNNQTRIIIVMEHQIGRTLKLRHPVSDAIYLQINDKWKLLPAGTQTNNRLIWLERNSQYPDQTMYWFQLPDGARQGG